jgi:hypothetical protein
MDSGEGRVIVGTLRALLAPRRLVPIVFVCVPLVFAQRHLSRPTPAVWLGIAMCIAFVLFAPVSWRVLFPEKVRGLGALVRLVLYVAIGAGVVLTIGAVIPKLFDIGVTFMTARPSLFICLALFLVGGWGLGRDVGFEQSLEKERSRAELLSREAERAQLLALRAQLDPHFLFNTLNCIAEWCREDGETAERAVLQLSAMLRAVFDAVKLPSWPLSREIELVEALFSLHRLRDPQRFTAMVEHDAASDAIAVPPLTVLPLAENAIKHGPASGFKGELTLRAKIEGDRLVVELENPGAYHGPRPGGSGIPNVERRLALAYGGRAMLEVTAVGERTRARLTAPLTGPDTGAVT